MSFRSTRSVETYYASCKDTASFYSLSSLDSFFSIRFDDESFEEALTNSTNVSVNSVHETSSQNEKEPYDNERIDVKDNSAADKSEQEQKAPLSRWFRFLGLLCIFVSSLFHLCGKVLMVTNAHLPSSQLTMARSGLQILIAVAIFPWRRGMPPSVGKLWKFTLIGVLYGIGLLGVYVSSQGLSKALALTVFHMSIVLSVLPGLSQRRNSWSLLHFGIVLVQLSGIVLFFLRQMLPVFQPSASLANSRNETSDIFSLFNYDFLFGWPVNPFGSNNPDFPDVKAFSVTIILLAMLVPVIVTVVLRWLYQLRETPMAVPLAAIAIGVLPVSVIGTLLIPGEALVNDGPSWGYALIIATLGIVGDAFLLKSLTFVESHNILAVKSLEISLVFLLQTTWLKAIPDLMQIIGIVLIVLTSATVAIVSVFTKRFS